MWSIVRLSNVSNKDFILKHMEENMKNKFVIIGFSSLFLVLTIAMVYLIIIVNKDKEVDSADIFKNSLKSVVELKSKF